MKRDLLTYIFTKAGVAAPAFSQAQYTFNMEFPLNYGWKNRSGNQMPKLSGICTAVYLLTSGSANACYINGNLYTEITINGTTYASVYDGVKLLWDKRPSSAVLPFASILPVVLFQAESNGDLLDLLKDILDTVAKGNGYDKECVTFCDAFYYEVKDAYGKLEYDEDEGMNVFMFQKMAEVNGIDKDDLLDGYAFLPAFVNLDMDDGSAATQTVSNFNVDKFYDEAKNGMHLFDTTWDAEMEELIPPLDMLESYVPVEKFFDICDSVDDTLSIIKERLDNFETGPQAIKNDYINMIVPGKPGTGKTMMLQALAARLGFPFASVNIQKGTESDTFEGMVKVSSSSENGYVFVPTAFLNCYKNGGLIVLEEFNLGDPGVMMGALGQAIEKPFILYEDGYRPVRRHPLCIIAMTMNSGVQGTREPSEAFTSRGPQVYTLDDPTEDEMNKILASRGYAKKDCTKVVSAYNKIINYLQSDSVGAHEVSLAVTMRHCFEALRLMQVYRKKGRVTSPFKKAVENTMIGSIYIRDCELAKQVYDTQIKPMTD